MLSLLFRSGVAARSTDGFTAHRLGTGLTVVSGRNGAGKTNLLEAVYFACTGRSCRTANSMATATKARTMRCRS